MSSKNISSIDAYQLLQTNKNSMLVDVRTSEEWGRGAPKIATDQIIFLSWRLLPDMSLNQAFHEALVSKVLNKHDSILFICRSGARSLEAAQFANTVMGFTDCYNIIDGFEGGANGIGWKQSNLPWQVV